MFKWAVQKIYCTDIYQNNAKFRYKLLNTMGAKKIKSQFFFHIITGQIGLHIPCPFMKPLISNLPSSLWLFCAQVSLLLGYEIIQQNKKIV